MTHLAVWTFGNDSAFPIQINTDTKGDPVADPIFLRAFRAIPSNFVSHCTGVIVRLRMWSPIQRILNKWFVGLFGIDMGEAELDLASYLSIEEVFTRKLRSGARPVQGDLCSPADGKLVIAGDCAGGTAVQAKGINYSVQELISGENLALVSPGQKFSRYFTVYLAPHNYHRVHAPLDAKISFISHIPGKLWPVNERFVNVVPQLFVANERMVFGLEPRRGGKAWIVMVGAFNVGRMTAVAWPNFATNDGRRQTRVGQTSVFPQVDVALGEELGTFMLGSTVIVLMDEDCAAAFGNTPILFPKTVRMGEKLI